MPKNQVALRRYKAILRALKGRGPLSSEQIFNYCTNSGISVSKRTIQKDLQDLRDDHSIFDKDLTLTYHSKDRLWVINEFPKELFSLIELKDAEIDALIFHAKIINQYQDYPIFSKIADAIDKVFENSNIPGELRELFKRETWLETENHSSIPGANFIMLILESIKERRSLLVQYHRFNTEVSKTFEIAPLLLKEDKHLWYLIGKNLKHDSLITLALDRIESIDQTNNYYHSIEFNSEEHFKYAFGITVTDTPPREVIISFTPRQGNYVRTLPVHHSQQIIVDNEKEFRIKIVVIPSYEFYSKILSYADQAKVIEPKDIAEQIEATFNKAASQYK